MGLIPALNEANGPITATQLAKVTGAEKLLIGKSKRAILLPECTLKLTRKSPYPQAIGRHENHHRDGLRDIQTWARQ